jgi:hypothetical protein
MDAQEIRFFTREIGDSTWAPFAPSWRDWTLRLLATIASRDEALVAERDAWVEAVLPGNRDTDMGKEARAEGPSYWAGVQEEANALMRESLEITANAYDQLDEMVIALRSDLASMTLEAKNLATRLRERTEEWGQEIEARKKAEAVIAVLEADNAALRAELETLRPAARKLVNEVAALGAFDIEVRRVVGNTNMNVLFLRRLELERAISVAPEEAEDQEDK